MSQQQFELNDESRLTIIVDHIQNNQGCTRSDLVRALIATISKKTIDKIIKELKSEGRIEEKIDLTNKLKKKLFVVQDNVMNIVTKELENFKIVFEELIKLLIKKILKIKDDKKDNVNNKNNIYRNNISRVLLDLRSILNELTDLYMIRLMVFWHKKIHDSGTLEKIYNCVFKNLSQIRLSYINSLENAFSKNIAWMVDRFALLSSYATDGLIEHTEIFSKAGFQQESEPLFKSIWDMYKEVYDYAFPEPRLYNWNISHSDGYKKFIEVCLLNPSQRYDNYSLKDAEFYNRKK